MKIQNMEMVFFLSVVDMRSEMLLVIFQNQSKWYSSHLHTVWIEKQTKTFADFIFRANKKKRTFKSDEAI